MPVWNPVGLLQLRGEVHCFMPWREVLPAVVYASGHGMPGVAYGDWFSSPRFMGEIKATYALPFAQLSGYVNYFDTPGHRWNFGLSFGLFFLAPRFMR